MAGIDNIRVGLYNEHFQMADKELEERIIAEMGRGNSAFNLEMGPMLWDGKLLGDTYLLEIHYYNSYKAHSNELGPMSFGAHLYADYAEKVHELAEKYCEENYLEFSHHLNSFPEFQAIVFLDKPAIKVADIKEKKQFLSYLKKNKYSERGRILHGIYKQLVPGKKGKTCKGQYSILNNRLKKFKMIPLVNTIADEMEKYSYLQNHSKKLRNTFNI
ncbi:hypothetical protein ACFL1H_02865 [Nanoarchaeota archaeon]